MCVLVLHLSCRENPSLPDKPLGPFIKQKSPRSCAFLGRLLEALTPWSCQWSCGVLLFTPLTSHFREQRLGLSPVSSVLISYVNQPPLLPRNALSRGRPPVPHRSLHRPCPFTLSHLDMETTERNSWNCNKGRELHVWLVWPWQEYSGRPGQGLCSLSQSTLGQGPTVELEQAGLCGTKASWA